MATNAPNHPNDDVPAADLIRQKVAQVYADEPDAEAELSEAEAADQRSKHQQFMYKLSTSGKDLAAIQTEWHKYYQALPDNEKHQVWQEFYASQPLLTGQPETSDSQVLAKHKHQAAKPKKLRDARSKQDIQASIRHKVTAGGQLKAKHHLQSLFFGLGMGFVVVLIFLFGFFNEVVVAPFIQPSRVSSATPIIVDPNSVAPSPNPEVIIPKINVQIPVDYAQSTTDENVIEGALENGVVHYPTTVKPGQTGNAAYFGPSSNNIFNKGKYKFAFVLLHTMVEGDTFYLTSDGKVYVYKVISRKVVEPTQVDVLDSVPGETATATLITCDPPGTSLHRLVVVGRQISPDPTSNTAAPTPTVTATTNKPTDLPGNGPTLLGRVAQTMTGKLVLAALLAAAVLISVRWTNRQIAYFRS